MLYAPFSMAESAPRLEPEDTDGVRRRDRVAGILILSVAFLAALSISWWAKVEATPEVSAPPEPPTTAGVVGFPDRVDMVANLGAARRLTARRLLRGIVADGVQSDGTVDVTKRGRIRYSFQSAPGEGAQPPREPDALPRRLYCGKQSVEIGEVGIGAEPDQPAVSCASAPSEGLPAPRCTPRQVWEHAVQRGVPTEQTARIEYFRSRVGPAWRFVYAGQNPVHRFVLDGDCARVLRDEEALPAPR